MTLFLKRYFKLFLLAYIIVLLTKILFAFYLKENYTTYNISTILGAIFAGYKFDFATSAFIALLGNFFDFNKRFYAIASSFFLTSLFLLQISDILYFKEAGRHIGYEVLDALVDAKSLVMTAITQDGILTIAALIISVILFIVFYKIFSHCQKEKINKYYIAKQLFLILLTIFFIRGMFQHIPLNPWQSNILGDAKLAPLVLNGTYNTVFALGSKSKKLTMEKIQKPSKGEITQSFEELYSDSNATSNFPLPLIKNKPNIVLFFSESWSAHYMKPYGYQAETTPNYDALLKQSLHPIVMIANGHRTTEGIFAVTASMQNPLGRSVAKTNLQYNHFTSIINELNKIGYNSIFFQGTAKETSGTGSLAQQMGFKKSYGKRDVKKRIFEENDWGIHDFDLYNFAMKKLEQTDKPFVIGINGATTHNDKLPKGIKVIHFTDTSFNIRLNVLHFADAALGDFVKRVQKKYPNTIFVLFADHCGGGLSGTLENYEIPFAIYAPQYIKAKKLDHVMSQRDIAPTLYDMIIGSYKKDRLPFSGKSIFSDKRFFADYYRSGILGWIENKKIVEINLQNSTYNCYVMKNFQKVPTQCTQEYEKLKKHALSFTYTSQKLLFEDKTNDFSRYRYK
ncbi:LTA synthase family protein [Sulfurimonas paralvinellae]|uniref:Sulfatase-like hydrolase/transferase n=1 Tax=Sulfurimonas paralvinellae TaxID=317658 RepID=A0A7M1B8S0_9BACT|nr:alkaline phosphatase family protein [Sulfurimonas paralvinellae]QOP46117.1 sulfatase-like hydrolase/transferase [Sulfurimonas paralvinellae]